MTRYDRADGKARMLGKVARWTLIHGLDPRMRGLPRERAARLTARAYRAYDRELGAQRAPGVSAVPDIAVRQLRDRSRSRAAR
jgi:hypothetical protein